MKTVALVTVALVIGFIEAVPPGIPKARNPDCPQICPAIYAPVCGTDGEETRMFSNKCVMMVDGCNEGRDFKATSVVACVEANDTRRKQPEVPIQGEPLESGSESSEHEAATEQDAPTPKRNPADCKPCTRIYMPVCGSDGKEVRKFSNECMMEYENCMETRNFSLLKGVHEC